MLRNHPYKARVNGNTISWVEDVPPDLESAGEHEVVVYVTENIEDALARSKKAAELLRKLSLLDPFRDIEDAVEWQRKIRTDRPLTGRE